MSAPKPTPAELAILQVLWLEGPSTVREIHTIMGREQELGYTTVLKFLQIMTKKGLVKRDTSAVAHVYEAAYPEEDTRATLVKDLVDNAFRGSAKHLVLSALAMDAGTPEDLAEIRSLIDRLEQQGGEAGA